MRLIGDRPERAGYLRNERVFHLATVVDALRRIAGGETVIDPTIVSRLLGRRRRVGPLAGLTGREREVALVADGLSNRAIASRLFVTERTVEAHVTQIFLKLRLPQPPGQHRRVLAVLAFLRTSTMPVARPAITPGARPGHRSGTERGHPASGAGARTYPHHANAGL